MGTDSLTFRPGRSFPAAAVQFRQHFWIFDGCWVDITDTGSHSDLHFANVCIYTLPVYNGLCQHNPAIIALNWQSFAIMPLVDFGERFGMTASSKIRPVTIKQVAAATGVHFSTVSRALNPTTRSRVKPQIATRILETARRLGYRTNTLASSLRTRRSLVIGVVVPDIASLLFPPILEGIESTLLKEGYMTIVANTANDAARHRRILSGMIERQVDGLILATAT